MSLRVFVADDSVTIQKIVTLAFAGEDVVIEAVSEGNTAFETLRSFKPDIALLDVFMPGSSGYEVCESVKEDEELKNIPVVLLVGTFEPFDEVEAARVKSDGHLTKPFDTAELIQVIRSLVGDRISAPEGEGVPQYSVPKLGRMTTQAAVASFLGANRILDLFEPGMVAQNLGKLPEGPQTQSPELSEEAMNRIVEKVVRRMSPEVIREVAWDVVPELSETIVRQTLKERE